MCLQSSQMTMEKKVSFPFGVNEIVTMSRGRQIPVLNSTIIS